MILSLGLILNECMTHDITTLTNPVYTSLNTAQYYIAACKQAVEQKNKAEFKARASALKNEVENLVIHIKTFLEK
jgi:hypothetical protein